VGSRAGKEKEGLVIKLSGGSGEATTKEKPRVTRGSTNYSI